MLEDDEGFPYPIVDKENCINCGLCEKVCPVIQQGEEHFPLNVYAARNKNEDIRMQSSSGGVFTLLAEEIIRNNGVVFGARFDDNWEVEHGYVGTIEKLSVFKGSKYVQSRMGSCYQKAKEFLEKGKTVLFSGTPCHIAGLRNYLVKNYDNLLMVDCLCHGVPSPMIWRKYLAEECISLNMQPSSISSVFFRNKKYGWNGYSFAIESIGGTWVYSSRYKDLFLLGMQERLFLRPICHSCPFRNQKSGSDITLGDFWGIEKSDVTFSDDKGTSMVLVNTEKGRKIFETVDESILKKTKDYGYAKQVCNMIFSSCKYNPKRNSFFKMSKRLSIHQSLKRCISNHPSLIKKLKESILGKMKYRIIVDAPGQTCNRLWSYLDTIGWAIVNKKKVLILFWDSSICYFTTLCSNPYVSFPFYNETVMRKVGERKYQYILKKVLFNSLTVAFYKTSLAHKLGIVYGWNKRVSFDYYPRAIDKILLLYRPNDEICKYVDEVFKQYRDDGYFIIGIHIRHGDYKTWENGRYYFEYEDYRLIMKNMLLTYKDKHVCFFISTNERYDSAIFHDFTLCTVDSSTAIHDLYALSLCNRIIGPLSTFSRWASFYGRVPLCFIERGKYEYRDCDFSRIVDFYHFENGVEIENLSDKKK